MVKKSSSEAWHSITRGESPPNPLGIWRRAVPSSPWTPRDGAGLLELDGVIYMLGGWNPLVWPSPSTVNEVWKSEDGGENWARLSDAPWGVRHTAGWLVGDGKLWVVGGDANSGHYQRDVWSGTPSGGDIEWVQVTANAAPLSQGRVLFQTFWHDDKIWIVGGQTLDEFTPSDPSTKPGSPYYDDVWSSDDGGFTWVQVSTGNSWAPSSTTIGSPVKDGYMWIIASGGYDTEGNPRTYTSRVIRSSDGENWETVTEDGGFGAGNYGAVVVLGDMLVLVGGYNGADMQRFATSKDGKIWQSKEVPWIARHAASAVSIDGGVVLLGGPLSDTSVWRMR